MKSVCISGGSGFIGQYLMKRLIDDGYAVSLLSREDFVKGQIGSKLKNCSIVINLAGESIAGVWTKGKRKRIYESRIGTTRSIVEAINKTGDTISLLIQVSGIGIYDNQHIHTEESEEHDVGFLSRIIKDWEGELANLKDWNLRIVVLRLGVVLDKKGGILKQILFPLRFRIGIGVKSDDYFPFIQLDDLMNVFIFCMESSKIKGVVNVSAPVLTKINQFFRMLTKIKNGKIIIWFSKSIIMLFIGESGSLLTRGQQVVPAKLLREGFVFRYDNIEDALRRACN
jgi:uncharacterized protein